MTSPLTLRLDTTAAEDARQFRQRPNFCVRRGLRHGRLTLAVQAARSPQADALETCGARSEKILFGVISHIDRLAADDSEPIERPLERHGRRLPALTAKLVA